MEYLPEHVRSRATGEVAAADAENLTGPAVVRRLKLGRARIENGVLEFKTDSLSCPLSIPSSTVMSFGTESISASDYCRRVLERGDMIDAVLLPKRDGVFPMTSFWIRIEYVGSPPEAGTFSRKDDGLFAMRAKAGEKAERIVARDLSRRLAHTFPEGMCETPGFFVIRYAGKRDRKPDMVCLACGLSVETKKRNKDENYRISHTEGRSFASENAPQGWHAFVFSDMKPRYVENAAILQAIADGRFTAGRDQYDGWVDINQDAIFVVDPPACRFPSETKSDSVR